MASEHVSGAGLAGRYATALFELASEARAVDAIAKDLARLRALIIGSRDLARLVRSPLFSRDEQRRAIEAILDRLGVHALTKNFVALLTQKRRLFAIMDIIAAFDMLVAAQRGELRAEVTSAKQLKRDQLTMLAGALKDVFKSEVRLSERVDPSLLGGLVVKVGSRQIDSSIKSKLVRLERAMRGA